MTKTYLEDRPHLIIDTECAPNYWNIGLRGYESGRVVVLERTESQELDRRRLAKFVRNYCLIHYSKQDYDIPMILAAMQGMTNEQLMDVNNDLIELDMRSWEVMKKYGLVLPPFFDQINLWHVNPGAAQQPSLKLNGGRLHSRHMMDLPFTPGVPLSPSRIRTVREVYLPNDLQITSDMRTELDSQIQIRVAMSRRYDLDLRSKSDAQIAEAVLKQGVEKRLGRRIYKPDVKPFKFNYEAPEFIRFESSPVMSEVLRRATTEPFIVARDGYIKPAAYLKDEPVVINDVPFQMGLGGLHSKEKSVSHYEDDDTLLLDRDVRGYYPRNIIKSGRNPPAMGRHFQPLFLGIVEERDVAKAAAQAAKAAGDKATEKKEADKAEGGKVMSNGTFGKTSQPGSVLYAPQMMLQTTLTGQFSLLMLITRFAQHPDKFTVLSANTDGIVTRVRKEWRWLFEAIIFDWEIETGLQTEETRYRSLHMRDVNNYIAFAINEKTGKIDVKVKGNYAESGPGQKAAMGMKKTPDGQICTDAAVAWLKDGTDIEKTIRECKDVRKFVVVLRVNNGAEMDGEYIGKAVRWYYSTQRRGKVLTIIDTGHNDNAGNTVPTSQGAMPMMTLPDDYEVPEDIDYDWYVREAWARIQDAGVYVKDPALAGRSGTIIGRLADQKTYHIVDAATGVALCGRDRKSIRDEWLEVKQLAHGQKICTKCQKGFDL